jgi:hypothetical protein
MSAQYTNETRLDRYLKSPEQVQDLYSSPELGSTLSQVAETVGIADPSTYSSFALLIGDFILGFYPTSELDTKLQTELGITPPISRQIIAGLQAIVLAINSLSGKTTPAAQAPEMPLENANTSEMPVSEAANTPRLEPLRTMQSDANRIHGYGAYRRQSDQPKPNQNGTQPLVSPPRYVDIEEEK